MEILSDDAFQERAHGTTTGPPKENELSTVLKQFRLVTPNEFLTELW